MRACMHNSPLCRLRPCLRTDVGPEDLGPEDLGPEDEASLRSMDKPGLRGTDF
jgi:hypothetical protein